MKAFKIVYCVVTCLTFICNHTSLNGQMLTSCELTAFHIPLIGYSNSKTWCSNFVHVLTSSVTDI